MQQNVGPADRLLRILLGSALLIWALAFPKPPYIYGGIIGGIFLVTGLLGWCGIYRLINFSTKQED